MLLGIFSSKSVWLKSPLAIDLILNILWKCPTFISPMTKAEVLRSLTTMNAPVHL